MAAELAIRAEGLTKTFRGRTVLSGINFEMEVGEYIVLTGDNGSGKTTFLRCLAGLARPDTGAVRWFGRSPAEPRVRRLMGMMAHETHLYPYLTLRENVILSARLYGIREATRRATQGLAAAGLDASGDRLPREVSHGMRRRTSLARALVHDPPLLLLDEPFSGLDKGGHDWLCDVLRTRQRQGRTTLLATHGDPGTRDLADRVLELRSGCLCMRSEADSERSAAVYVDMQAPGPALLGR